MEPLKSVLMPAHAVLVEINAANSWPSGSPSQPVRLAYIATNSSDPLSFVSLQSASALAGVLRVASRPSRLPDMPFGLVVEVHLSYDLQDGESVTLALAQAAATTYYPPQQIDDTQP